MSLPPHHGEAWDFIDEFLVVEILLCKDLSMLVPREKMHKLLQTKDMNVLMARSDRETLLWYAHLQVQRDKARKELRNIFEQDEHTLSEFLRTNKQIAENCQINVRYNFGIFIDKQPESPWYDKTVDHIIDQLFMGIRSHVIADILGRREEAPSAD